MKLASTVIVAGLIASLLYFSIESATAVETMMSGVGIRVDQLDIFSDDVKFDVFALLLISIGLVCFMTLRGKENA